MARLTYHECVQQILKDIARNSGTSILYDELVDRVIREKHSIGEPIPPSHRHLIWCSLVSEAEKDYIRLEGERSGAKAFLTPAGLELYTKTPVPEPVVTVDPREELRKEYLELDKIVTEIMQALHGSASPNLLLDAHNVPSLVRNSVEAILTVEDTNKDILERIDMTADHIDHLLAQ
ncbi:hypothetical protein C2E23DRAFT_883355 [Lenzites betulinus]|nr:hypothetical protein C2E23DRAFT_883355 [Lenzites betulinus]